MPTGIGESLLFLLPAFCATTGMAIAVVLLVSLRADLMRRAKDGGISCVEWDGHRPADAARIVLVTPESTVRPAFLDFLCL
jgi:superfamily II DNA helicase RecQ